MIFNNIQEVHDFVHDSKVSVQISFFGTAFLCKKERIPVTFFGREFFHITKTTASISIEDLAKKTNKLAIALRDSVHSSERDKKLCNDSVDKLFKLACQSLNQKYQSNFITKIFVYTTGFFSCGEDDDVDFVRDIYEFKGLDKKIN